MTSAKKTKNMAKKVSLIYSLREKGWTLARIAKKVGLSSGGVGWHLYK